MINVQQQRMNTESEPLEVTWHYVTLGIIC